MEELVDGRINDSRLHSFAGAGEAPRPFPVPSRFVDQGQVLLQILQDWQPHFGVLSEGSSGVTQLFFCNLTESDLKQDSPVG